MLQRIVSLNGSLAPVIRRQLCTAYADLAVYGHASLEVLPPLLDEQREKGRVRGTASASLGSEVPEQPEPKDKQKE